MEWTVEDHLRDQPDTSVALFHRFTQVLEQIGPFTYSPAKTTVTFKGVRRGFAGARPDARGLTGYLDLQRPLDDPRIRNVAPYTKRLFVNHFRLTDLSQVDDEFIGWMREAYAVGAGAHLD
jgi:hypothetical protein